MKRERFDVRRGRLLANAAALLIVAGASGVLALLLVETGGNSVTGPGSGGAVPESAEHAIEAPTPNLGARNDPQPTQSAAAISDEDRQAGEPERGLIDTLRPTSHRPARRWLC